MNSEMILEGQMDLEGNSLGNIGLASITKRGHQTHRKNVDNVDKAGLGE